MVTESEIVRRNVAIAKFMGWEETTKKNFKGADVPAFKLETEFAPLVLKEMDFAYHSDWSWLMPAVEKALRTSNPPIKITMLVPDAKTYGPLIDGLFKAVSDYCLSLEVK